MNFFQRQDDSLARSKKFYLLFAFTMFFAVVVLYFAISIIFVLVLPLSFSKSGDIPSSGLAPFIFGTPAKILSLRPFLMIGTLITLITLMVSIKRIRFIREGGGAYIAAMLDADLIEDPSDKKERQLLNIVEEMSLAAGLPSPHVYIIPDTRSINAITAGVNHEDAIIAVTEGAIKYLNREEMQGVIAHEFAHILNGDYSLNLTMAGWLYGLLFFYIQGRNMLPDLNSNNALVSFRTNMYFIVAGGLLMAAGWVGKIGAQIIQAAFSREREYLADAFAVQFTRNPLALAGALKKIVWVPRKGLIKRADAEGMRGFFIVSPSRKIAFSSDGFFDSHPPLEKRILELDPAWDGEAIPLDHEDFAPPKDLIAKYSYGPQGSSAPKSMNKAAQNFKATLPPMEGWPGLLMMTIIQDGHKEKQLINQAHLHEKAEELFSKIPKNIRIAIGNTKDIPALVASAFTHKTDEIMQKQNLLINKYYGPEIANKALYFHKDINGQALEVLSQAANTLKRLRDDEKKKLIALIEHLITAKNKVDIFDIAACQILKKNLGAIFKTSDQSAMTVDILQDQIKKHTVTIISLLAYLNSGSPEESQKYFDLGMNNFVQWPLQKIEARENLSPKIIFESFDQVSKAPHKVRGNLVKAASDICLCNHKVNDKQYHLLWALTAAVDLALPLG